MNLKIILILLVVIQIAVSQENEKSIVKQLSEHQFQLQEIAINTKERQISFPASVNMQKGLIEVFVCSRGGKTHESIFVADIIPYYLQVSLLMIGLTQADPKIYDQNNETLHGDRVQVYVEWMIDKKKGCKMTLCA